MSGSWEVIVMKPMTEDRKFKLHCPVCHRPIASDKWLVGIRIDAEFLLICQEPPPTCCGKKLMVPRHFETQDAADAFASEAHEKMAKRGNTKDFLIMDVSGPGFDVLRLQ